MTDAYAVGWRLMVLVAIVSIVTMSVSAYCNDTRAEDDPLYGIMASGERTFFGACACGPGYEFGTLFYVPGFGWAVCMDRGGQITDMHLDIWLPTEQDALRWGRQEPSVLVVEND